MKGYPARGTNARSVPSDVCHMLDISWKPNLHLRLLVICGEEDFAQMKGCMTSEKKDHRDDEEARRHTEDLRDVPQGL